MGLFIQHDTIFVRQLLTLGFGLGPHDKGSHSYSSHPGGTGSNGPDGER